MNVETSKREKKKKQNNEHIAEKLLSVYISINEPSRATTLEFHTGFISILMSYYKNSFRTLTKR